MAFGADIIAGFPTETDEMFENTMRIVEECNLTFLHVFPYSERDGTPAARIPNQVDVPIRKERAARLRSLGDQQLRKFHSNQNGKEAEAIVENGNKARTENFALVHIDGDYAPGSLVKVKIKGFDDDLLQAKVVNS
jgi:threonylcarbamoyladenosine tRNA methylthiotransferase MtaB